MTSSSQSERRWRTCSSIREEKTRKEERGDKERRRSSKRKYIAVSGNVPREPNSLCNNLSRLSSSLLLSHSCLPFVLSSASLKTSHVWKKFSQTLKSTISEFNIRTKSSMYIV